VSAERHSKTVRTSVKGPAQDYELRLMDISIPEPSVEGDAEIVESESYLGGTRVLVRGRGEWTVVD